MRRTRRRRRRRRSIEIALLEANHAAQMCLKRRASWRDGLQWCEEVSVSLDRLGPPTSRTLHGRMRAIHVINMLLGWISPSRHIRRTLVRMLMGLARQARQEPAPKTSLLGAHLRESGPVLPSVPDKALRHPQCLIPMMSDLHAPRR